MVKLRFEWDEAKNLANQRKHGIRFEQAIEVFKDPLYVSVVERIDNGEERWQTFGLVGTLLLVMVAHTVAEEQKDGTLLETIRVVSARYADNHERRIYEDGSR